MKKGFLLLVVTLFVVSCAQSSPVPTTAPQPSPIVPTNTPQPSPTATLAPTSTPLPLSGIDLESIIIEDGDLPAGFSGAQIRDVAPGMFRDLPLAQNTVYQQLEKNGETAGGIAIFLYDSQENVEEAYNLIVDGMTDDAELSNNVGEKATTLSMSMTALGITTKAAEIVFVRCGAVVHIRMTGTSDVDSVVAYAKRLDRRIEILVCR